MTHRLSDGHVDGAEAAWPTGRIDGVDLTSTPSPRLRTKQNKTPRQYGNNPIFARGMPIFSTNLSAMAEFGTATTSHPP